jgi:hypothetical protein
MIKQLNLTNPADLRVVNGWIAESRIRMVRALLLGSAAVILAGGLAVAAVLWATRPGVDPEALTRSFRVALASLPPLPVTGSVTIADGGKVALSDGGKVALQDGGSVALKDGGEVELKAESVPALPQPPPLTPQQRSEAIKREVTVFTSSPFAEGEVVSGWKYPSGEAKQPDHQYCYFSHDIPGRPTERIDLVVDGVRSSLASSLLANVDAAIQKCVWWQE